MTKHIATFETGKVKRTFIPLEGFEAYIDHPNGERELLGVYLEGRRYYLREHNTMLEELCNTWRSEGKIRWEIE